MKRKLKKENDRLYRNPIVRQNILQDNPFYDRRDTLDYLIEIRRLKRKNERLKSLILLLFIGMIAFAIGLCFIGLASATTYYGGDCFAINGNFSSPSYIVQDNSSNLDGLTITYNGSAILTCIPLNYSPDNFTLIFLDNQTTTNTIIQEVHIGGGSSSSGGGTHYIYINGSNNTRTIEIPKYIKNETIREVPIDKPFNIKTLPLWAWLIICGFALLCILSIIFRSKKKGEEDFPPLKEVKGE